MKIHRISLSAESYARLAYISALEQISPKDWIEERIKDAWSLRDEKAKNPIIQLDDKPKCGADPVADIPQKRKRLSTNPDALNKIKEMVSQSPKPSFATIAREIGYPKPTVFDAIQRMKKEGDLPD